MLYTGGFHPGDRFIHPPGKSNGRKQYHGTPAATQGAPSRSTSYLTLLPPSERRLVNLLNGDAELASDTGRELGLPALTNQMFPTTLRTLP